MVAEIVALAGTNVELFANMGILAGNNTVVVLAGAELELVANTVEIDEIDDIVVECGTVVITG